MTSSEETINSSLPLSSGIGLRIVRVRGRLTQQVFADSLGLSKSSLVRYEKEMRLPDAEIIARICATYPVDVNWLVTGKGEPQSPEVESEDPCTVINRYDIGASAGGGAFLDSLGEPEMIAVDRRWLRELSVTPAEVSMIYARGDSMQPTILDGDMLLVSSRVEQIRDGIYISRYDGLLQVKRLQRRPRGVILVTSDNSADDPFSVNLQEEGMDFAIVGRVVWVGRKLGY